MTLKYDLFILKMNSGAIENDSIEFAVLKNPQIDTEIVSVLCSPSRSHFSPGLKLILQTQVANPEHGRFQSFSKGVYAYESFYRPTIFVAFTSGLSSLSRCY